MSVTAVFASRSTTNSVAVFLPPLFLLLLKLLLFAAYAFACTPTAPSSDPHKRHNCCPPLRNGTSFTGRSGTLKFDYADWWSQDGNAWCHNGKVAIHCIFKSNGRHSTDEFAIVDGAGHVLIKGHHNLTLNGTCEWIGAERKWEWRIFAPAADGRRRIDAVECVRLVDGCNRAKSGEEFGFDDEEEEEEEHAHHHGKKARKSDELLLLVPMLVQPDHKGMEHELKSHHKKDGRNFL